MRAVLIINPVSGDDEPNEEKVSTIQKWLTSAPFVAEVCYITKERGAGVIAREAVAAGVEVVLVGGGDGTVSEVARELVHKPANAGHLTDWHFQQHRPQHRRAGGSACRHEHHCHGSCE